MHLSIPKDALCEFINIEPIQNTLYSKCQIKVCYVDDAPNRNGTVITKDTARKMANSLPGCPIVGFYNKEKKDFEGHNKEINLEDGKFSIKDVTRPYGFVDLNAKVWFQKFIDDNSVEREYLVTEGIIWDGVYKEAERILDNGNNQSMELDEESIQGNWTYNQNSEPEFFIINDAIISKLCILGEDVEPCFEGAQIKTSFSLDKDFQNCLDKLIYEFKQTVEGGKTQMILPSKFSISIENENTLWTSIYEKYNTDAIGVFEEDGKNYVLVQENEKYFKQEFSLVNNVFSFVGTPIYVDNIYATDPNLSKFDVELVASYSAKQKEEKKDEPEEKQKEEPKEEPKQKKDDDDDDEEYVCGGKKKKKEYSLEEIPEYQELLGKYNQLNSSYSQIVNEKNSLQEEVNSLKEFKLNVEKAKKEDMINSFYMLSDEDKSDVIKNINTYSLDEIEQKLSVICVRKKVNFTPEEPKNNLTYNLQDSNPNGVPAWLQEVENTVKSMK